MTNAPTREHVIDLSRIPIEDIARVARRLRPQVNWTENVRVIHPLSGTETNQEPRR